MKRLSLALLAFAFSMSGSVRADVVPHLELELESRDYQKLLEQARPVTDDDTFGSDEKIQPSLDMGKRLLEWLAFVNKSRPDSQKISFTSPETTVSYPIAKPNRSNPDLIAAKYAELKAEVPEWIRKVVFEKGDFIAQLPGSDAEFIKHGFNLDRNYQSAARWTLQQPYLWQYSMRRNMDVRGYYTLNKDQDLGGKFQGWADLGSQDREEILTAMVQLCRINVSDSKCKSAVDSAKDDGEKLAALHAEWLPAGKKQWDSNFKMSNLRKDVLWSGDLMELPFQEPKEADIRAFLVDNIQDEWKWNGWNLKLKFDDSAAAYVRFVAGATPNVNGLGGNRITMDANAPLTEYGVQWTIRHEFGHVLGFPDCYIEFYDNDEKVMINYQLDTTNLMCSRRGKLQDIHYEALKEAYGKDIFEGGDDPDLKVVRK